MVMTRSLDDIFFMAVIDHRNVARPSFHPFGDEIGDPSHEQIGDTACTKRRGNL